MDYEIEHLDDVLVFKPTARTIDQSNADSYLQPLKDNLRDAVRVVLDMSSVRFLNSAGLGAIVAFAKDVQRVDGTLRICAPLPTVQALFKMVRLNNIVPIDPTREASLLAIAQAHG